MTDRDIVERFARRVGKKYVDEARILSFWEFLQEVQKEPYATLRSAAQYLRDMIESYGSKQVDVLGEKVRRHLLFDGVPSDPDAQRVVGEEHALDEIYREMRNFAMEGRADRMILLHGPNGSSKTTIADLLFKGLEEYSAKPEGCLYRFSWIFPKTGAEGRELGFGGRGEPGDISETLAYLPQEEQAAVVPSDLKTNPFFLVPREDREELLRELCGGVPDFPHGHILRGDMGTKSRAIFEALLTSHQGDWKQVMRYVRVERFRMSRRYRTGAVTIEPQSNVDAEARQVTPDLSLQNLPPALQNLRLMEVSGDLIDANRGLVEYSDFLKRPLDLNKYLLTTTEKGTVRLPGALAYLDLVLIGSANEKQLDEFKRQPIFTSFKGRMELVTVPYLLEYEKEVEIYRDQLNTISRRLHITPHTARVAALWAVLTRLWRPDPAHYEEPLKSVVTRLTPLAKALLYQAKDPGELEDLTAEDVKTLRDSLSPIAAEYRDDVLYEGRFGASPREMKTLLLDASYATASSCLTPIAVLSQLRLLVREKTVYDFLKLEPKGGYNDAARFVDDVERAFVRVVLRELNDSMELVDESEYDRKFDRYFHHAVAYVRGTRVRDPVSGESRDPDPGVLAGLENLVSTGSDIDLFRKELIAKIGAYSVDRPGEEVNFKELFPELLRALKSDFYATRMESVRQVRADFLLRGTAGFERLTPDRRERVETMFGNLEQHYGYCPQCALEMLAFAVKRSEEKGGG
ncbi:MAG: serine protein kinase PrkA [Planctomycetota bacterium]